MASSPKCNCISLLGLVPQLDKFQRQTRGCFYRNQTAPSAVMVLDALAMQGPHRPQGEPKAQLGPPPPFLRPTGPTALSPPGLWSRALPATTPSGQWLKAVLASQAAPCPWAG